LSWIAVAAGVVAVGAGVGSSLLSSGDKPQVPDFPKLDLDMLQKLTISGNARALESSQALGARVNEGNRAELLKAREAAVPGGVAAAQKNILDQLTGVADITDTRSAIRNLTAANFNLGVGGASQFSKFGIVSGSQRGVAAQKQQGLQNFVNFSSFLDAPRFDPTSMFFSPSQRVQVAQQESEQQFQVNLARASIAAQPSKTEKALGAGLGSLSNLASMGFGSAIGGGGGGGGGGGTGGGSFFPSNFGSPPNGGSVDIPGRFNFQGSRYGSLRG